MVFPVTGLTFPTTIISLAALCTFEAWLIFTNNTFFHRELFLWKITYSIAFIIIYFSFLFLQSYMTKTRYIRLLVGTLYLDVRFIISLDPNNENLEKDIILQFIHPFPQIRSQARLFYKGKHQELHFVGNPYAISILPDFLTEFSKFLQLLRFITSDETVFSLAISNKIEWRAAKRACVDESRGTMDLIPIHTMLLITKSKNLAAYENFCGSLQACFPLLRCFIKT